MRSSLFRKEAVNQVSKPIEGSLLLSASPKTSVLTLMAFVFAISTLVYLYFGEFNRKANVKGYLSPDKGLVKVFPQATGTLLESRIKEGMLVSKGQILAVISTERGSLQVRNPNGEAVRYLAERQGSLDNELASLRNLDLLRVETYKKNQVNLSEELAQLESAIRTSKARMHKSRQESERYEGLKDSGFVTSAAVYRQQDVSMELRGRLQMLERDRIALHGREQALESENASGELSSRLQQESIKRRI